MMNGGQFMYRYIECNRVESDEHFKKFRHVDEIKSYIDTLSAQSWHKDALKDSVDEGDLDNYSANYNMPDVHVYRIKDITDAINTSVILDMSQKVDYNRILSDHHSEFDADLNFLEICENVGECDIY